MAKVGGPTQKKKRGGRVYNFLVCKRGGLGGESLFKKEIKKKKKKKKKKREARCKMEKKNRPNGGLFCLFGGLGVLGGVVWGGGVAGLFVGTKKPKTKNLTTKNPQKKKGM